MSSFGRSSTTSWSILMALCAAAVVAGCSVFARKEPPIHAAEHVDLDRYMGPWFIVAGIGLGLEDGAHDAVETYTRNPDGSIATVFQFRKDSFDGFLETYPTTAWVEDGTGNAEWRVRTFWPLRQQYLIAHLEPDYSVAIVARDARDYVWILSRSPQISEAMLARYREQIAAMGYDMTKFRRYPQNGLMPEATRPKAVTSAMH